MVTFQKPVTVTRVPGQELLVDIETFKRIWKEWSLGVKSMVYQRAKGPVPAGDLERFRKLETRMDEAWRQVAPFEREVFMIETRRLK